MLFQKNRYDKVNIYEKIIIINFNTQKYIFKKINLNKSYAMKTEGYKIDASRTKLRYIFNCKCYSNRYKNYISVSHFSCLSRPKATNTNRE